MWGYRDQAQIDQALVEAAKTPAKPENKVGLFWSTHGLIWFMESGTKQKRYVGALRLKKKTLAPNTYKRLLRGERLIAEYDAKEEAKEK